METKTLVEGDWTIFWYLASYGHPLANDEFEKPFAPTAAPVFGSNAYFVQSYPSVPASVDTGKADNQIFNLGDYQLFLGLRFSGCRQSDKAKGLLVRVRYSLDCRNVRIDSQADVMVQSATPPIST